MLRPLIQVNLPLMFYINEIPTRHSSTKKRLYDFFYSGVTAVHQVPFVLLFSVTQYHKKR